MAEEDFTVDLARNTADPSVLEGLAGSGDFHVRLEVVANQSTPASVVSDILRDERDPGSRKLLDLLFFTSRMKAANLLADRAAAKQKKRKEAGDVR